MDETRFDQLTRALGAAGSRRGLLRGLAGFALGGWGAARADETSAARRDKPAPPKPCRPEGKRSKDPSRCCSKATSGGVCCGEAFGSCAKSGCCGASATPFCVDGACIPCLPEGATPIEGDPGTCCSKTTADGLCCGEHLDSCAVTGCCADPRSRFCVFDRCVTCLPEGEPIGEENASVCCSGGTVEGRCCGTLGQSCEISGCCSSEGAGPSPVCDGGRCVPCRPEGEPSDDPELCCGGEVRDGVCRTQQPCYPVGSPTTDATLCCSLLSYDGACVDCLPEGAPLSGPLTAGDCCAAAASGGVCCGIPVGSCAVSGCCPEGFTCCNGTCVLACPPPLELDPATCQCSSGCAADGAVCGANGDCCSGACCGGICRDTQTDRAHCGGCGLACPAGGPTVRCEGGVCGATCGGEFCPLDHVCATFGGGPVPAKCCPTCSGATPYPFQCGDGVCCCNATTSYVCVGNKSRCS